MSSADSSAVDKSVRTNCSTETVLWNNIENPPTTNSAHLGCPSSLVNKDHAMYCNNCIKTAENRSAVECGSELSCAPVYTEVQPRVRPLKNPISELQELCLGRKWRLPEYRFPIDRFGPIHQPTFTVQCTVLVFNTAGQGHSKKSAKTQAAIYMLEHIKSMSIKELESFCCVEDRSGCNDEWPVHSLINRFTNM